MARWTKILLWILLTMLTNCRESEVTPDWLPIKVNDLLIGFRNEQEPMFSAVKSRLKTVITKNDYFYFAYYDLFLGCQITREILLTPEGLFLNPSKPQNCASNTIFKDALEKEKTTLGAIQLENHQQQIFLDMSNQVLPILSQKSSGIIGTPGRLDWGAYMVKFSQNGITKTFFIDADLAVSGNEDIVKVNKIFSESISKLYSSEMGDLK